MAALRINGQAIMFYSCDLSIIIIVNYYFLHSTLGLGPHFN